MQLVDEDVSAVLLALKKETSLKQLHSHPISEYNAMHKYFIPFIPLHDFFKATSRDTSCTYFYLRYCRFSLVFEITKNLRNNEGNA